MRLAPYVVTYFPFTIKPSVFQLDDIRVGSLHIATIDGLTVGRDSSQQVGISQQVGGGSGYLTTAGYLAAGRGTIGYLTAGVYLAAGRGRLGISQQVGISQQGGGALGF